MSDFSTNTKKIKINFDDLYNAIKNGKIYESSALINKMDESDKTLFASNYLNSKDKGKNGFKGLKASTLFSNKITFNFKDQAVLTIFTFLLLGFDNENVMKLIEHAKHNKIKPSTSNKVTHYKSLIQYLHHDSVYHQVVTNYIKEFPPQKDFFDGFYIDDEDSSDNTSFSNWEKFGTVIILLFWLIFEPIPSLSAIALSIVAYCIYRVYCFISDLRASKALDKKLPDFLRQIQKIKNNLNNDVSSKVSDATSCKFANPSMGTPKSLFGKPQEDKIAEEERPNLESGVADNITDNTSTKNETSSFSK